jgi:hypothetical protein
LKRLSEQELKDRQTAYKLFWGSPAGRIILDDLRDFCRAKRTSFHPDARVHAALEGRREVWLRIEQHVELSFEELIEALGGNPKARKQNAPDEVDDDGGLP